MNKRLDNGEFEKYVCTHFGDLYQLSNKLYYKVLKWEKQGMRTTEAYGATKQWVIWQIENDKTGTVEIYVKKWVHGIDVDWETRSGIHEWIYLIETFGILMWIRVEIDGLTEKIIDIVDTNIIKYPEVEW